MSDRCFGIGFAWSPDGSMIAYSQGGDDPGILLADPDGTTKTRLPGTEDVSSEPAWSPDGASIAFAAGGAAPGLYVADVAGAGNRLLAPGSVIQGNQHGPVWSSDGTRVAFESSDQGRDRIYVANADPLHRW